jgi:hypothetical protein
MNMKQRYVLITTLSVLLLAGCRTTDPCDDCWEPPAPSGVYSITGDGYVEIIWNEVYIHDLDGYRVYWSSSALGEYQMIGWSNDGYYIDEDVDNGYTYFYAVTAVDYNGNESELSYETVFDTPRPAGRNLRIEDYDDYAGVDFSGYYHHMIQHWEDWDTDMYLFWDADDERYALASTDVQIGDDIYGTDIQDAGWVDSLDELDWAPAGGWTPGSADIVSLVEGRAYWVWTWDNHFAKFQVTEIGEDYVDIDWAFQIDEGNPELVIIAGAGNAPETCKPTRPGGSMKNPSPVRESRASLRNALAKRR